MSQTLLDARVVLRVAETANGKPLDARAITEVQSLLKASRGKYVTAIRALANQSGPVDRDAVLACFTEELRAVRRRNGLPVGSGDIHVTGKGYPHVNRVTAHFELEAVFFHEAWQHTIARLRQMHEANSSLYQDENALRGFIMECLQNDENAFAIALYRAFDKGIFTMVPPIFVHMIDTLMPNEHTQEQPATNTPVRIPSRKKPGMKAAPVLP